MNKNCSRNVGGRLKKINTDHEYMSSDEIHNNTLEVLDLITDSKNIASILRLSDELNLIISHHKKARHVFKKNIKALLLVDKQYINKILEFKQLNFKE